MKVFFTAAGLSLVTLISTGVKAGYDIRTVPVPNSSSVLVGFGYNSTVAAQMLAEADHKNWAVRPTKGWTAATDAMRARMMAAIKVEPKGPVGVDGSLAAVVINMCKATARDPYHCALYVTAVMCAESSCGQADTTNIFGRQAVLPKTKNQAVKAWLAEYNDSKPTQGWYVANEGYHYGYCRVPNPSGFDKYCDNRGTDFGPRFFYSDSTTLRSYSTYCTSEKGTGYSHPTSCPNGLKNSTAAYLRVRTP